MENFNYEYSHDSDRKLFLELAHSFNTKPHFHRSTELLYVLSGNMLANINAESTLLSSDDIVFVHGYAKHSFLPKEDYDKFVLIVPSNYADDFDNLTQNQTLQPILSDKEFNKNNILPLIKKMFDERETMPHLVQKGYINIIFGSLFNHYPSQPLTFEGNMELLVSVLQYIDQNYYSPLSLDSLATTFGYSKYHFSKLFNKYVGENINNYINMVRLQHFTRLLKKDEHAHIATLAFDCGFDSLTTFYRYYNKLYDNTPKNLLSSL